MNTWKRNQPLIITILLGCLSFTGAETALGDPPTEPVIQTVGYEAPVGNAITVEQLEREIADLDQSSDVAADAKAQATENFRAAIKNLKSAADSDTRLKTLIAEAETVADRAAEMKKQLAELKDKKPSVEPGIALAELEQLLPTTELQLSGLKKARQDAEAELQARAPRRKEIRARMAVIQEKIADATGQLKTLAASEPTPQSRSLAARLLTRRMTLEKEKPALEGELAKYDAEEAADLVRLRMEVATAHAAYTEKLVALLQQRIDDARASAAEEAVRKARREAIFADPALKIYAERNQQLAESAKAIAAALAETNAQLTASTGTHDDLLREFARTRKKVDSVGLTSSVGALLRKQITTLPDVDQRRGAVAERQRLINDTQYQLLEYEEDQQELAEFDELIERILTAAKQDSTRNVAVLESAARDLLARKREYLDDLVRSTGQYFDTLIELDTVDQQIIKLEAEYANYIDQRVLWIRSGPSLTAGVNVEESGTWLLSTAKWREALTLLSADARRYAALYIACFGLFGVLRLRGSAIRKSIKQLGEAAEKANCRSIYPTLRSIWLTTILALAWPLVCVFIGWRLGKCAGESEFTDAIGQGLKVVGILWASIELVRQSCRHKGIGESHFRWPVHATSTFRRQVKLCTLLVLPIVFVTATLASSNGVHERGDVQRISFILGLGVVGFAVFRLLRPAGLLREYLAANPSGFVAKTKHLLPVCGTALPFSLAVLAAAGYFYTAQTLFWRLFATCMFVATLVTMRSVLYRMLLLRRRHLSMEQARERAAAATQAGETGGESHPVAGIVTENTQPDISTHSLQSRKLVSTGITAIAMVGMWMIWIGVLPALSMIGNYPLWGKANQVVVASEATLPMPSLAAPGGSASSTPAAVTATSTDTLVSSVTISDLALAILIVVVTGILFRNGPGLLEISLLQQLPLDASVRYAITTLVSYVIIMVGTIAACSTVGLEWSQIQWLATALTFGLAFGLQEMFANFVAGLIILLERPIRVGDIVTVDDVTGVVSRIRIRATSITNWDRKEYVVPNKEFITGRLLNWTLSDKVNRVVVEVGVAYGSDTERARELLLQVAHDHPVVLNDPASIATFESFGDNSLNLVLRAFLPSLENRLQVIHELHSSIDQAFRKENIEIAFPQRDLHIRSVSSVPALGMQLGEQADTDQTRNAA